MIKKDPKEQENKKIGFGRSGIRSAISGAVSGLISSIVLQPLDVIKTNLIILPKNLQNIKKAGMLESFRVSSGYIYQERGIKGFWVGTIPGVAKAITSAGTFFYVLPLLQYVFRD